MDPGRVGLIFIVAVVLVPGGWWLAHDPNPRESDWPAWGWALFIVGILMLPVAVREMLRHGPRLVLSRQGIEDRTQKIGLIPWSEIERVELVQINREKFLALQMRNADAWNRKVPAANRIFAPLNRAMGLRGIPIMASGLTMSPEALEREVNRRLKESTASRWS